MKSLIFFAFRWFHKSREAGRIYEIRAAVEEYDDRHQEDEFTTLDLEDQDWLVIKAYITVVKPFEMAYKVLGGDSYPAACMVIPMLDQVNVYFHSKVYIRKTWRLVVQSWHCPSGCSVFMILIVSFSYYWLHFSCSTTSRVYPRRWKRLSWNWRDRGTVLLVLSTCGGWEGRVIRW